METQSLVSGRGFIVLMLVVVAAAAGYWLGQHGVAAQRPDGSAITGNDSASSAQQDPEILYWVAPMDANYRRDQPGKSPMGMDLVPVYAQQQGDKPGVQISSAMQNSLGVRRATVERQPLVQTLRSTGTVQLDETLISHLHMRTQGWVENLTVFAIGDSVTEGELLFELYSPELVNAQKEYLQAVTGRPGLGAAAEERLLALGMARSEIVALQKRGKASNNIRFFAPRDGFVSALNIREGMHVMPDDTVLSLASLEQVWMDVDVLEAQAAWLREGQDALAQFKAFPGEAFPGVVEMIYPELDPMLRTLRLRLVLDNPLGRLKPHMFGKVLLEQASPATGLVIPREAVLRGASSDRVVLARDDGRFSVQEIKTGLEGADWVEVRQGLAEGQEVVSSAQFLIDSEASLNSAIERLQDDHAGAEHDAMEHHNHD